MPSKGRATRADQLRHRINAGRVAVSAQVQFFDLQFGRVASEWKSDDTRVTFADFAISEKVFAELRRFFPEDDFCSEESNPQDERQTLEARYSWVIDPIDGTNNYARGFPVCAISLALFEQGVPVYGFVYDYSMRRLLEGGSGYPLLANRQRIQRDPLGDDPQVMIGMHFPLSADEARALHPLYTRLRVRSFGSGTLLAASVATGYLNGTVDTKVRVWDVAAAYALCQASGITFRFLRNSPFPLKTFHVRMDYCPYVCGDDKFCSEVSAMLDGVPLS